MKRMFILNCILFWVFVICFPAFAEAGELKIPQIDETISQGDTVRFNHDILIDQNVSGNVVVIKGNADVKKTVNGDVVAIIGDISIDSTINGSVVAVFGNVTLSDNAVVEGSVVCSGKLTKSPRAKIMGQEVSGWLESKDAAKILSQVSIAIKVYSVGISTVLLLILGLPTIVICNRWFKEISKGIDQNFGKRIGIGILVYIAVLMLTFVLMALLLPILIYLVLIFVADILVCLYLGRVIGSALKLTPNIYLDFILGISLLFLAKLLVALLFYDVNILGYLLVSTLLGILIDSFGLGILFDSKLSRSK